MQKVVVQLKIGIIHLVMMQLLRNLCFVMVIQLCQREKIEMVEHSGTTQSGITYRLAEMN